MSISEQEMDQQQEEGLLEKEPENEAENPDIESGVEKSAEVNEI